jgi:hypothetical protein
VWSDIHTASRGRGYLEACGRSGIGREQVAKEALSRYKLQIFEEKVDIYLRQRVRVTIGCKKGTITFRSSMCLVGRGGKNNRIGRLRREDGVWLENEEEKRDYIANYFSMLFRSNGGHTSQQLLDVVETKVSPTMNESLMKEFTKEEIKAALLLIGDLKDLGLNGMPTIFYKNF